MNYSYLTLSLLGILGILIHNVKNMNEQNKKLNGELKLGAYLKIEKYSILLSVLIVIVCVLVSQEIKKLQAVGEWLGFAFIAIGYMGQSLLVSYMGKAESFVKSQTGQ